MSSWHAVSSAQSLTQSISPATVADDTERLKAALALPSTGGTLRIPTGTYRISSEIAVERDNVTVDFEDVTIVTRSNISMLRFGAAETSNSVYKGVSIRGRLTIQGAGSGNANNVCLTIRNVSYGHFAASVRITNCGGTPFLFASYRRGVQHNYIGGGWEISGNPGGAFDINADGVGGYINDNTFQTIRAHSNGPGGLTQARIRGQTIENNTFVNLAVETRFANDRLLSLETGIRNTFIGLRLDGISATRALDVAPNARGNLFVGLSVDGSIADRSNASVVVAGHVKNALPFIRLGSAQQGPSSLDLAVERLEKGEFNVRYGGRHIDQVAVLGDANRTPTVALGNTFRCSNRRPTTITAFSDLVDGHRFTIIMDAKTTIQHGTAIKLAGGVAFVGTGNDTISFVSYGGVAYETGRSVNG
jgi:hypothetical protein